MNTPAPEPSAVILAIGDELALGQSVDTNSAWLSARLSEVGLMTRRHETVADDQDAIARAISRASQGPDAAPLVLVTGGLGPTADDLTREALAQAMGVDLEEDPAAWRDIQAFFEERGRTAPDRNRVQALCPKGGELLENPFGTAPALRAVIGQATLFCLPGVPREMKGLYVQTVGPAVHERFAGGAALATAIVHSFGMGESDVAERLGDLMRRDRNPTVGTTVSKGVCSVRIRARADSPGQAQQLLEQDAQHVRELLGPAVFGQDTDSLAGSTIEALKAAGLAAATAESCTGGLVGAALTDTPGASSAYLGGWVTYHNHLKHQQLGVPQDLLDTHGAVSAPVAVAMAKGALERASADLAVSVTGVAGPDGGTDDKPVGMVFFALADAANGACEAFVTRLPGDRAAVRRRASLLALQLLRLRALGEPASHIRWADPVDAHVAAPQEAGA
ncbi:MAG: competence/damage-inducible protein A [Planctomycetota bacterium]